jgi:hypothetical protein
VSPFTARLKKGGVCGENPFDETSPLVPRAETLRWYKLLSGLL